MSKFPSRVWVRFGNETGMPLEVKKQDHEPTIGFGWVKMVSMEEMLAVKDAAIAPLKGSMKLNSEYETKIAALQAENERLMAMHSSECDYSCKLKIENERLRKALEKYKHICIREDKHGSTECLFLADLTLKELTN